MASPPPTEAYRLMLLRPEVVVRLVAGGEAVAPDPPGLTPAIEAAWGAAQRRAGGRLFNGRIVSVVEASASRILGRLAQYRHAVAGFADPALGQALAIRPLSVCGVLRTPAGILFGRRDPGATYEAGLWQMPPAGSVDAGAVRPDGRIDPVAQIAGEMEEEVGLPWARVRACRPFALVAHAASGVHDLGLVIETAAGEAEILARRRPGAVEEYTELRLVPEAGLPAFLAAEGGGMVPAARLFLSALGLVSQEGCADR